jgi:hypothetical protein
MGFARNPRARPVKRTAIVRPLFVALARAGVVPYASNRILHCAIAYGLVYRTHADA